MKCKVTNKKITPFMSFGKMPIANGFLEKKDFDNEFFFNMEIGFAEDISLFQLKDHPSPEQMFNNKYPFFTGSSEYMKIHFSKYAKFIKNNYLNNNSKIVEIGSNDGTFLKNFKDSNLDLVGLWLFGNQLSGKKAPPRYLYELEQFYKYSKVVAVGEIGLDYHYNFSEPEIQKKIYQAEQPLLSYLRP